MNSNEEFMKSFNIIEGNLRKAIDAYKNVPFYELVEKNAEVNKLIKQFRDELKTMGDLRNFIVHGEIGNPLAIASENTIKRIRFIESELTNPMKIEEIFSKNVIGVKEQTSLKAVLDIIKEDRYSQFPVLNEKGFIGFITENGIANWFANNIKEDMISVEGITVKNVLEIEEEKRSYSILYAKDTLYDVIEKFEDDRKSGNRILIIVVLNSPKDNFFLEDIYTIITPWDLDLIYRNLGLKF